MVVRRRDDELCKMYFSGIASKDYLTYLNPSTIHVIRIRRVRMIEAMKPTSKPATQANMNSLRFNAKNRNQPFGSALKTLHRGESH